MEQELLELAKLAEFNSKAEAQAVFDYSEMLKQIDASNLEEGAKNFAKNIVDELIRDELNHQIKLQRLYTFLTGLEPNEN